MTYRNRRQSHAPRVLTAKYPGKCACCGGDIKAGEIVEWIGATRQLFHFKGSSGDSSACYGVLRAKRDHRYNVDPGELAADRWNETHS